MVNKENEEIKLLRQHNDPKYMGHSQTNSKRKIYSDTGLTQETKYISNKQSNLTPKGTRKRTKLKDRKK